jgi:hypothetical protein
MPSKLRLSFRATSVRGSFSSASSGRTGAGGVATSAAGARGTGSLGCGLSLVRLGEPHEPARPRPESVKSCGNGVLCTLGVPAARVGGADGGPTLSPVGALGAPGVPAVGGGGVRPGGALGIPPAPVRGTPCVLPARVGGADGVVIGGVPMFSSAEPGVIVMFSGFALASSSSAMLQSPLGDQSSPKSGRKIFTRRKAVVWLSSPRGHAVVAENLSSPGRVGPRPSYPPASRGRRTHTPAFAVLRRSAATRRNPLGNPANENTSY